jgi:hypothetical protein
MSSSIWNKAFLIALLERVVWTFLQTFVAAAGLDAVVAGETGLDGVRWVPALVVAGTAALLSLVKGIGANAVTKDGPGTTHAETVTPVSPE